MLEKESAKVMQKKKAKKKHDVVQRLGRQAKLTRQGEEEKCSLSPPREQASKKGVRGERPTLLSQGDARLCLPGTKSRKEGDKVLGLSAR